MSMTFLTRWLIASLCMSALSALAGPDTASQATPALQAIERVDLQRYMGVWHEIARYPNRFQKGCLESSAVYSLRDDGDILVLNRCKDSETGKQR